MWNIVFLILGALILSWFYFTHLKHKAPVIAATANIILGSGSLVLANMFLPKLGITIAVNLYTTFISAVLGLPGVILMAIAAFINNFIK